MTLTEGQRRLLTQARRAVMATTSADGRPRLVPVCYALAEGPDPSARPRIYTPLDEKPKRHPDPHRLARVRDLLRLPEVTLLVDRWDEDWARLAWLRAYGTAQILEAQLPGGQEHDTAVALLRARYPQYAGHALEERPIIRISIERLVDWAAPLVPQEP